MAASSPALPEADVARSAAASDAPESGGTAETVLLRGTVDIATAARAPPAVPVLQANQPDPTLDCFSAALM
eukprot:345560-Karenia_brevis.AAC.1